MARGSQVTSDVYLRRLGSICSETHTTPKAISEMSDEDLKNFLLDLVSSAEAKGLAGSYIRSTLKAIRSWLSHNMRDVPIRIKVKGADDTPSLRQERVPTPEEFRRILLSCDKKTRVACILVANSGLRIGVLGNYLGREGLRIKDFPEIKIEDEEVTFETVPTLVTVRRELSKGGHQYFTFLGEEGCDYIKDYLEERIRDGEILSPESAIITPKGGSKEFITATNISTAIREAMRATGIKHRPYVLRAFFDTQLMLAESKGLILRDYREFWMGHKGDIESRYTTNKHLLPEHVKDDMRGAYRKAQQYLQTAGPKTSEDQIKETFRTNLLKVAGFTEEEIETNKISDVDDDKFNELVKRRLLGQMINNGATQKVVRIEKIEQYIDEGWEYVSALPNGKAILKLPR